jgi:hypothetical protein
VALVAITFPLRFALVQRPSVLASRLLFADRNSRVMAKRGAASAGGLPSKSAKKVGLLVGTAPGDGAVVIGGALHAGGGRRLDSVAATAVGSSVYGALPPHCLLERARLLTAVTEPKRDGATCVMYWMSRDQVHVKKITLRCGNGLPCSWSCLRCIHAGLARYITLRSCRIPLTPPTNPLLLPPSPLALPPFR